MNKNDNPFSIDEVRLLNLAKDTVLTGLEQLFVLCIQKDGARYRDAYKQVCQMFFLDSLQAFEQIYYIDEDGKVQPQDMIEQIKDDIDLLDQAFYKIEQKREEDD